MKEIPDIWVKRRIVTYWGGPFEQSFDATCRCLFLDKSSLRHLLIDRDSNQIEKMLGASRTKWF